MILPLRRFLPGGSLLLAGLALVAGLLAGCDAREPDQATCSGAYAIYRSALERGDHARLFRLLDRNVAAKIELAFSNIHLSRELIRGLPVPMQGEHLERLGAEPVRRANSSSEFLGALVGGAHKDGVPADFWRSLTRQFKSCHESPPESGMFTAVPMDGHGVRFVRHGDGLLYHVPSEAELLNLQKVLVQSARALEQVRATAQSLRQESGR